MKCAIEIKGNRYDSVDFNERHVTGFLSGLGSWGINLKEFFEGILAGESSTSALWKEHADSAFREFTMRQANENMAYILEIVFPSLKVGINDLDTTELCEVANQMMMAWAKDLQVKNQESPTNSIYGDGLDLKYPPRSTLSPSEVHAIGHASREMNHSYALVECWYQWWKAIESIEEEPLSVTESIDLIIQESENPFNAPDSDRYYTLIQAYLQTQDEPIAA